MKYPNFELTQKIILMDLDFKQPVSEPITTHLLLILGGRMIISLKKKNPKFKLNFRSDHKRPFSHNPSISASMVFNPEISSLFRHPKQRRSHRPTVLHRLWLNKFNNRHVSKRHCQIFFDGSLQNWWRNWALILVSFIVFYQI
jgi:hypothetical protein